MESPAAPTSTPRLPAKPTIDGIEAGWAARWEESGIYRFARDAQRDQVYSIDTPPPTVSGSLHVGHVFSYTHTDLMARYKRMRGFTVFYPMGWDDNGLPTERRVQNYYGVRCEPALPYDPDFTPPANPDPKRQLGISRGNFIELCQQLTVQDEKAFEELFARLGLSVDWTCTYQTIDERARATSQWAFLRNLARGEAYQAEAPTLWDVTFRTAVAQAELEDREQPGAYHRLAFPYSDGSGEVHIETTRPELLAACVALVAHPQDERYRDHFGRMVHTPVFGVEVPVLAHPLADPEKGSGIAMICTFGDTTDVTWWRELELPTRPIIGWDGRILPDVPAWISAAQGRAAYQSIAGMTMFSARARMVELLRESGLMSGEPRPITHPVKFYEKGDKPLEIVTTRQWYIRNGGRDIGLRAALVARGTQLKWHPPGMAVRYTNWVEGLSGDWLISRQRFFGVPIPLWYRVDPHGNPDYHNVLVPDEDMLPVDPSSDAPPGFTNSQRGEPGGFVGDPDVMDTWATSSLTPQIAGGWHWNPQLWAQVSPMNLRPQAHEIIRTWLFATVVRSHLEDDRLPFSDVAISGWILDPDRKKMSKSKGNVVTPMDLLERHGSDAVRYWAASGRPGTDTAYDEGQMKIGRRLAIKILNASKFVLGLGVDAQSVGRAEAITEAVDRAQLAVLADVVAAATEAFEDYNYTRAMELTEAHFWSFCDDYLELIKDRAYQGQGVAAAESARATLATALSVQLRLFAPFLPFVTEEVWSWWQEGSIHLTDWPQVSEFDAAADGDPVLIELVADALSAIRKAKSEAKASMRAEVAEVRISLPAEKLERLAPARADLAAAGRIAKLHLLPGDPDVSVVLAGTATLG